MKHSSGQKLQFVYWLHDNQICIFCSTIFTNFPKNSSLLNIKLDTRNINMNIKGHKKRKTSREQYLGYT